MISKRIAALLMLLIIMGSSVHVVGSGLISSEKLPLLSLSSLEDGSWSAKLEEYIKSHFLGAQTMEGLAVSTRYLAGETKQEGVFLTPEAYIEDIAFPDTQKVLENEKQILAFREQYNISTSFALIPTKIAIKQEQIPSKALSTIFNQASFIESTYNDFSGKITSIDVYSGLFEKRAETIYYRTDPNLTSLGGYYVYVSIAERLGMSNVRSQKKFEIRYLYHDFEGILARPNLSFQVPNDVVSIFALNPDDEKFQITHRGGAEQMAESSIYTTPSGKLKNPMEVYLRGNPTGDVQIVNKTQRNQRLLIIGDDSILSAVPFLAMHYDEVRVVNLERLTPYQIEHLNISGYGQVLFAYSVDTFIHSDVPSRIRYNF